MKKRDIILDFTSLLDVTLIIIFFFVLFSHLDEQENKARTDAKVQELESAIQEAEDREATADELLNQLKDEIAIVQDYSERQASNVTEMLEFNRSDNIKLILDIDSSNWSLRVLKGESVISTVAKGNDVVEKVKSALSNAGYDGEETIFCDFIFDGSQPGTASAYKIMKKSIEEVAKHYKHMYISETDLSIGEKNE